MNPEGVIMSTPPKPDSIEETVYQLWWVVIGMNGDGLKSKVERALEILEKREQEDAIKTASASTASTVRNRRKVGTREWALIAATALPTLLLCYITWKMGFLTGGAKP
jgi:hypothetical protein